MNRITFAVKSAIGLALMAPPALVFAQTTASTEVNLEEVVVTGIRHSVEKSLDLKRAATNVQEVVTAGRFTIPRARRHDQFRERQ